MTIVQIGSNIGNTESDPIYHMLCSIENPDDIFLVLIEPHPRAKSILEQAYHFIKNKVILSCGCGANPRVAKLYADSDWDNHVSQHSSLNKDHLIQHDHTAEQLTTHYIPILPLPSILDSLNIKEIDYLQIDTEGSDREILTTFSFENYHIKKLQFEIAHWSAPHKNDGSQQFIDSLCNKGWIFSGKTEIDVVLTHD